MKNLLRGLILALLALPAFGQSVTIKNATISNGTIGSSCGPPLYSCTRTDLNNTTLSATVPNVGGLTGMNNIVTDDMGNGNRIVRATDANFDITLTNTGFVTAASGSGDENLFSQAVNGHYLLCLQSSGTRTYVVDFNSKTFQVSHIYVPQFPSTGGFRLPGGTACSWAYTSNLLYVENNGLLQSYDFTDWLSGPQTTPPTPVTIYNFINNQCLGSTFNDTWEANGGNSKDDSTFCYGFSNNGGQGTGFNVACYNPSQSASGCSGLNINTGAATDYTGTSLGIISLVAANPGALHNVKIFRGGSPLNVIYDCSGTQCPGINPPVAWQIASLNVFSTNSIGHFTNGYAVHGFGYGCNAGTANIKVQLCTLPIGGVKSGIFSSANSPVPIGTNNLNMHNNWSNVDVNNTFPWLQTVYHSGSGSPLGGANPYHANGVVTCTGTTSVAWQQGHLFNAGWTGSIWVGGTTYTISGTPTTTALTTTATCPTGTWVYSFLPYTVAWETGEIQAVTPGTGIVHRFGHTYTTGEDANVFDAGFSIGTVSQDGKYFAFTSDWLGTVGCTNGATACDSTSLGRSDVFIIELR